MTAKLKASFKRAWLEDLRAHPELQGQNRLTTILDDGSERDCCLGRACKLLGVPRLAEFTLPVTGVRGVEYGWIYDEDDDDRSEAELPKAAIRAAVASDDLVSRVFFTELPIMDRENTERYLCLEVLNDSGFTFPQIADVIDYFFPAAEGE